MNNTFNKAEYKKLYQQRFDEAVKECITKDFPVKGVDFIDIFPLLNNTAFEDVRDILCPIEEDIVILPESRGFIFAGPLGVYKSVFLRKKGKLPGELIEIPYKKEYGVDILYLQKDALLRIAQFQPKGSTIKVCVFDDVLATGGTAKAIIDAINNLELDGYIFKVTTAKFYIEIAGLGGRQLIEEDLFNDVKVESLYEYSRDNSSN